MNIPMSAHSRIQLFKAPIFCITMVGATTGVFLPAFVNLNAPGAGVLALSSSVSAVWLLLLYSRLAERTRSICSMLPHKSFSLPLDTVVPALTALAASTLAARLDLLGAALPAVFATVLCSTAVLTQAFARSPNVVSIWLPQLGLLIAIAITPLRTLVVASADALPHGAIWPLALFPIILAFALDKRVAKNWRHIHAGDLSPLFLYDAKAFKTRRMSRPEAKWMQLERTFLPAADSPQAIETNLSAAALGIQRFSQRPARLATIVFVVGATAAAAIGGVYLLLPQGHTGIIRDTMQVISLTSVTLALLSSAGFSRAECSALTKRVGRRAAIHALQRQSLRCVARMTVAMAALLLALEATLFAVGLSGFTLNDLHRIALFFALCLGLAAPTVAWLQSLRSSSADASPFSPSRIGLVILLTVPFAALFAGGALGFGQIWTSQPSAAATFLLVETGVVAALAAASYGIALPQARRRFLRMDL